MADDLPTIAADWADRAGELDAAGRAELRAWLAASPDHAAAFDRFRRLLGDGALFDAAAREPALPPAPAPRTARRRRGDARPLRRRILAALAACGIAAVVVPIGWEALRPVPVERQDYASTVGGRRTLALPDGSRMTLDAASRVAIAFGGEARELTLVEGAARFDVRHDPGRPFRVASDTATMTALGTDFSVERLPGGSELRVFRGRVRLDATGYAPVAVAAGSYASVRADGVRLGRLDDTDRIGWRDDWLDGDAIPLATALARLQRYSVRPLRLADPSLGTLRISGRFRLDTPERSLHLIGSLFDLSVATQGDSLCVASARYPRCATRRGNDTSIISKPRRRT